MNIRISIAIFILLSFLNIGAISSDMNSVQKFGDLENKISNISEFEENGVKLQYKTKDNMEKEILRVKEYLTKRINGSCNNIGENQVEISNKDMNINVKMWCEGSYSYVEIILLNDNSKILTSDLKNTLENIVTDKAEDVQYFLYYNAKTKQEDQSSILNELIKENGLEKVRWLEISNGYTGEGYLSNVCKINFALVKYNTGSHIIIGTPIIFTTY